MIELPFDVRVLPTVNAVLNGVSAVLLAIGYVLIRQGRIQAHRRVMLAAFGTSALFLVSYLLYHAQAGSTPFTGQGLARWIYFPLLISHIILAALIVPLALVVLHRGLTRRYAKHRPLARWVLPLWLYVSVTGVVIYLMLYHLYPAHAPLAGG